MNKKTEWNLVFSAIEKAIEVRAPKLTCGTCGSKFFMTKMVGEHDPDFVYIEDDGSYNCDDHITYDLLFNPDMAETILMGTTVYKNGKKIQVHVKRVDASLFLPHRLN